MISCQTVIQIIEKAAPKKLAFDWDNCGLMVGSEKNKVKKILVTLTVTEEVIDFAIENGFDMIISHHPLLFKPLKSVRWDTPIGNIIYKAIKNDIIIYSAHTNMDIAPDGVNDILANILELENVKLLEVTGKENYKKMVVCVPEAYQNDVRAAMVNAGAGWFDNYSHLSFNANGIGTFKPEEGTIPFIGEIGKIEHVKEVRIETIVPENLVNKVANAMLKAHPYEEVAYDIYPLENMWQIHGLGRIGYLKEPLTLLELSNIVKQKLNAKFIKVVGDMSKQVYKIAVCGGSGGSLVKTAASAGADVFITGDIKYHDAEDARALDLTLIDVGHFYSENILIPELVDYLKEKIIKLAKDVEIQSYLGKDPFEII